MQSSGGKRSRVQPYRDESASLCLPGRDPRHSHTNSPLPPAKPQQETITHGRGSEEGSYLHTRLSKNLTGLCLKKMLKEMISLSAMGDICL